MNNKVTGGKVSYLGTKLINAEPMSRAAYDDFRGWELPADEDGTDEGYLVEYVDGGKPNTLAYTGYVSWSPKEQFEAAYRRTDGMNFGMAIEAMKMGKKVARAGWNSKGMWLMLIPGSNPTLTTGTPYAEALGESGDSHGNVDQIPINAHIDMFTAYQCMQPGWLASQADMLADDWAIV